MISKIRENRANAPAVGLSEQLQDERRTVDFDTFDIHAKQLIAMLEEEQIWIAPAYQRKFRWNANQCSQLIESLMLGIPVPSLFMATNKDSTWEVVDGVQRLSTIVKFAGSDELRARLGIKNGPLKLEGLKKLTVFDGLQYSRLPASIRLHFDTRPMKVVTLSDKSDMGVRYDLFERLNTGGVPLSQQEIRDCVYAGKFSETLDTLSRNRDFCKVVKLTPLQQRDATAEECVLRFFAFKDRYKEFKHSVKEFLDDYMKAADASFDYDAQTAAFNKTFSELAKLFPNGLRRPGAKRTTPLNLYEGVAVGAALAIKKSRRLDPRRLKSWLGSDTLRRFTTGATNDPSAVTGRIEYCRDRFLGKLDKADVSATAS